MKNTKMKLKARWDKKVVPANEPRKRGLLINLTGSAKEKITERTGVNLALSIDRSGSMGEVNMQAAKEAAIGVVERMTDMDVLSIVDFDDRVTTRIDGVAMTPRGKRKAINAIHRLRARGCTALGAGWFEAARCVSAVIDRGEFQTGHVLLLSDGRANSGVTDPAELTKHAAELADRGVTTSTLGIGAGYSPLQLEALAEGGRGRMHDAEGGAEIIEVIMGELGETRSIVATDTSLVIRWPHALRAELLANFDVSHVGNSMTIKLGHLVNGIPRTIPILVDVPALPEGEVLKVELVAEARNAKNGSEMDVVTKTTKLKVVPPAEERAADRNTEIAERIAHLWKSTQMLEAMRTNERGDYAGAAHLMRGASADIGSFAEGLDALDDISASLQVAESRVSRAWNGRSKREAMMAAKKFSKSERDHRSGRNDDIDRFLNE